MWLIRRKLFKMLFSGGSEKRVVDYYQYLGDDILDDFHYQGPKDRHSSLETRPSLWLNCGYWKNANNYADAGADMARLLAKVGKMDSHSLLLDVGCGFAEQDLLWAKEYGTTITALDLTPLHVQIAQKRIRMEKLEEKIEVMVGNATQLEGLKSGRFTHVVALECAFHFNTRGEFFRKAFALLPPGGCLLLTDLVPKAQRPIDSVVQRLGRWYTGIPRANMVPVSTYKEMLKAAGFTDISVTDISESVFPGFNYYGTNKKPKWGVIPREYFESDMADPWYYYSGMEQYILVCAKK
eukprot:TRINITY_DN10035_c0_g1_i1.p1 TRINITY_DN10035_c0_g1~~TRINITY_DN10035_c0_g1_i1.p1  ORF type:complete len:342 (-),score=47.81 TRINITY_DN10035_c0_g1_i1:22-906(-)